MKKLLTAITLTMAAQSGFAGGFAPWDDREVTRELSQTAQVAAAPAGFAPWRDRATPLDPVDGQVQISESFGTEFRPWS